MWKVPVSGIIGKGAERPVELSQQKAQRRQVAVGAGEVDALVADAQAIRRVDEVVGVTTDVVVAGVRAGIVGYLRHCRTRSASSSSPASAAQEAAMVSGSSSSSTARAAIREPAPSGVPNMVIK
jgi:hypothetical protein